MLIKPYYILFVETKVQDTLGPNVYGLYFGIFNIAFILQIIADLGIQNYNSRTIARDPSLLRTYLPKILGTKMILSAIYLVVGISTAAVFGYLADSGEIFLVVSLNLILLSLILYLRSNVAATGHYRLDSVLSVLDKLFLIIILSYLLYYGDNIEDFSIYSFVYSQSVAYAIVLLIVLVVNFKFARIFSLSFDKEFTIKLLKKSLPFSLVIILMSLYMRMDGFMLEQLLDDEAYQAGVYAASFRIYEAFNMIGFLFSVLLLPMFASLLQKRTELLGLIKSSHNLIFSIASLALAGSIVFRDELMYFLYPLNADENYGTILVLLMFSYFAISLSYIYGTFLTASGALKKMNLLLFIGVLINFVLNLIFIPGWGAKGAALVTIVTQFFVLGGQYIFVFKRIHLTFNWFLFLKRLAFLVIVAITAYFAITTKPIDNWFLRLFIFEVLLGLIALLFGFIQLRDLKRSTI